MTLVGQTVPKKTEPIYWQNMYLIWITIIMKSAFKSQRVCIHAIRHWWSARPYPRQDDHTTMSPKHVPTVETAFEVR